MEIFAEAVYDTMCGELLPPFRVPGVERIFEAGMPCHEDYRDMLDAYERLRQRLGVRSEDDDCEIMIRSLLDLQRRMAIAMFLKGYEFGQNGCQAYRFL